MAQRDHVSTDREPATCKSCFVSGGAVRASRRPARAGRHADGPTDAHGRGRDAAGDSRVDLAARGAGGWVGAVAQSRLHWRAMADGTTDRTNLHAQDRMLIDSTPSDDGRTAGRQDDSSSAGWRSV